MAGAAERVAELRRVGRAARRQYGGSAVLAAARAQRLRWRGGFDVPETFRRGLLDPSLSAADRSGYVSKHRLLEVQRRVNPEALAPLTENKVIFQRCAEAAGLPVPALVAVLAPRGGGSSAGGLVLGDAGWERVFLEEAPEDTVLKPATGYHGEGVRALRRRGGQLAGAAGTVSPAALREELAHGSEEIYVLQERARNHPAIVDLTGAETLQTVRMVTAVGDDGRAELLFAVYRLALADADVDNLAGGVLSNGFAVVEDLAAGVLGEARRNHRFGGGHERFARHPRTGARLEGYALPFWDEALELVVRGAEAFLPVRTLGWDVGLTPDGPVVVETNAFWNPHSHPWMKGVVDRVAALSPGSG